MMPFEYLIILVLLGLLVLGYAVKEYFFGAVAAMGLMVMGIYISINGLEDLNNIVTQAIALIFIATGAYFFIRGVLEKLKD